MTLPQEQVTSIPIFPQIPHHHCSGLSQVITKELISFTQLKGETIQREAASTWQVCSSLVPKRFLSNWSWHRASQNQGWCVSELESGPPPEACFPILCLSQSHFPLPQLPFSAGFKADVACLGRVLVSLPLGLGWPWLTQNSW